MKMTKEEILKGCEHDGSYIPVSEVKRLTLQEYAEAYHKEKLRNDRFFKGSPLHDKAAIIALMDTFNPAQMVDVVEYLKQKGINQLINKTEQKQSTTKSTIERKDFFESQMEDETLREELIKFWDNCEIDGKIKEKIIDNYLNQKNKT